MRRATVLSVGFTLAMVGAAYAQSPVQRQAPPQAVEGWAPTAPEPEKQKPSADPWQAFSPVAPGIRAGNFIFSPAVTAAAFYDDNVFAAPTNRQGSWGYIVRPELGLRTAGQSYAVGARGYIEKKGYERFGSEEQTNGGFAFESVVMPGPDTQLVGKARYTRGHEDRGSGESELLGFDRPVGYNTFEASGAINQRFNRWWTSLGVAGSWMNYDTPTIGGIPIDQSYRNGNVTVGTGRVGYVVAPLTSVFVEVAANRRNFQVDAFDSRGYRVVGGVLLEPGEGARLRGEAFAGYMHQDYTGITFNTVSTFTYGGSLSWLVAPRWTAVAEGRRNALESGLNGGVSLVESLASARLDYLVAPNFVVGAGASYLVDEFLGAGRTDRTLSPLVSLKYLINPFLTVGFDYRNVSFGSNGLGTSSYYRNVYLFSINARI